MQELMIVDNKKNEVIKKEPTNKKAKYKAIAIVAGSTVTALVLGIIIGNANKKDNKEIAKISNEEYKKEQVTPVNETKTIVTNTVDKAIEEKEAEKEVEKEVEKDPIITDFYNNILNIRTIYPDFANVFNTIEDVENYVNFIRYFDNHYQVSLNDTSIKTLEDFNAITDNYLQSCIKYQKEPQLSNLFTNNTRIKAIEKTAAGLYGTEGSNDFTAANEHFTALAEAYLTPGKNINLNTLKGNMIANYGVRIAINYDSSSRQIDNSLDENSSHVGNSAEARHKEKTYIEATGEPTIKNNGPILECPDGVYQAIVCSRDIHYNQDASFYYTYREEDAIKNVVENNLNNYLEITKKKSL